MKQKAFSAVRWTSFSMIGKAVIAFLQLIILARILEPSQLGLVAVAMVAMNTAQIISDMGVSSALIHYHDVSENELSSLYWLNIITGGSLTLIMLALSPVIASFYNSPDLTVLLSIGSSYFLIWAAGQQHRVLSEKALDFSNLAKVEVAAFLAGFTVTIIFALGGQGALSVILGYVTTAFTNTALAWLLLSKGWRPKFHFRIDEISRFWRYGLNVIIVNVSNTLALQSDVIVSGRVFGLTVLGLYSQPRELCLRIMFVINPIITRVAFPLIASSKNDKAKVRKIYLGAVRMTASINFPIYLAISAFAPEIVQVVLGDKFADVSPLLRIFGVWCALRSIGNPISSLLFAVGATRRAFLSAFCVMLSLYTIALSASQFGPEAIMYGYCLFYALLIPCFWAFLVKPTCGAQFVEYHLQILFPAVVSVIATAAALYSAGFFVGTYPRLLVGVSVGLVSYILGSMLLNRPWLQAMLELLSGKLGRRR